MTHYGRHRIARFGRFELSLHSRELKKDGIRIRLEDKPARLLCVLVNNAGILMMREELVRILWADGEHVDFDHGLNKSINKLRLALGDDSSKPTFIETLSRRGYRFIAPVSMVEDSEQRSGTGDGATVIPQANLLAAEERSVRSFPSKSRQRLRSMLSILRRIVPSLRSAREAKYVSDDTPNEL